MYSTAYLTPPRWCLTHVPVHRLISPNLLLLTPSQAQQMGNPYFWFLGPKTSHHP